MTARFGRAWSTLMEWTRRAIKDDIAGRPYWVGLGGTPRPASVVSAEGRRHTKPTGIDDNDPRQGAAHRSAMADAVSAKPAARR